MAVPMIIGTLSVGRRRMRVVRSGEPKPRCMIGRSERRIDGQVRAMTAAS